MTDADDSKKEEKALMNFAELSSLADFLATVGPNTLVSPEANPSIGRFIACLESATALGSSFRRGGEGPPDFALLHSVAELFCSCGLGINIMRSLSTAVASADLAVDFSEDIAGTWILVALVVALPILQGSLPKDKKGMTVLPHEHPMKQHEADKEGVEAQVYGSLIVWNTRKMCDRCMEPIHERVYFHCAAQCDVDFCSQCHDELQGVLDAFLVDGTLAAGVAERMLWSVFMVDQLACQLLSRVPQDRKALADMLTHELSAELFAKLTLVVVDVCNAKVLYNDTRGALTSSVEAVSEEDGLINRLRFVQQVTPIYDDIMFWCSMGLLQFLYACNNLWQKPVVDEGHEVRGPKIDPKDFVLGGIDKCKPEVEWRRWHSQHGHNTVTFDILNTDSLLICDGFRSLIAHNNVLPISFRRQCLLVDLWLQMHDQNNSGNLRPIVLEVDRDPAALIDSACEAFRLPARIRTASSSSRAPVGEPSGEGGENLSEAADGSSEKPEEESQSQQEADDVGTWELRQPLKAMFKGEEARGPGVLREFFQVAIRSFLVSLFEQTDRRTYWFSDLDRPEAFFACGVLLGQAILHNERVPKVFPWPFFELLLRDFGSPLAPTVPLSLAHLAAVSPVEATSLQKVLDYEEADIEEIFGELGWERTGDRVDGLRLSQETKHTFVQAYVDWCFAERLRGKFDELSEGFRAVLGKSLLLKELVDRLQFELIVCGGEEEVDVAAIRRRAKHEDWKEDELPYVEYFWKFFAELDEAMKRRLLLYLTASDHGPLEGWESLRIIVQKNGEGDDRLPTAYTCFSLLLLPKYSCEEVFRAKMRVAITNSEGFGLQ
eukprot:TRINITY_DN90993_c0_g1_i1.p1 TRINITY_DN90993_c0_g1~~TRINITY_DN90993_c0_g1_i1.p1  ORF type:complete len:833 (-),score=236.68 TRINITY_DN90993_c0_g1_i1:22-2520(-)